MGCHSAMGGNRLYLQPLPLWACIVKLLKVFKLVKLVNLVSQVNLIWDD